jgi:hypothetical protein
MLRLLEEGTSASELAAAIGMSKQTALNYLNAAREHGIAVNTGPGQTSRWQLPDPGGEARQPEPYGTIQMLADAVAAGQVQCDDEQREILMRAREIAQREQNVPQRGHLRLVPAPEMDDGQ